MKCRVHPVSHVATVNTANLRITGQQWRQSTKIYETSITCQGGIGRTKKDIPFKGKNKENILENDLIIIHYSKTTLLSRLYG